MVGLVMVDSVTVDLEATILESDQPKLKLSDMYHSF
jgi:hypothetical protein